MKAYYKIYIPIALIVAFFSEFFFYPFSGTLRISLGILSLSLIMLVREDIEPIRFSFLCGLVILLERTFMIRFSETISITAAFWNVFPSLGYYVLYGVLFKQFKISRRKYQFFSIIILISVVDMCSNIFEAILRHQFYWPLLKVIALTGIARSFLACLIFIVWQKHELFILNIEHQKRYSQLNAFVANIEGELFYLRKSAIEIENVMCKSYQLFEATSENSAMRDSSLEIAKDIHEIKKDYIRVITGFENLVDSIQTMEEMSVSKMFEIMKTNFSKILGDSDKKIELVFEASDETSFKEYIKLFTILNNLVDNSISACSSGAHIHISYEKKEHHHIFRVIDTGSGMDEETIQWIFEPGFTTKYNATTGKSNTGIGLNHVKNVVDHLGGTINVESIPGTGTKFTVVIPESTQPA